MASKSPKTSRSKVKKRQTRFGKNESNKKSLGKKNIPFSLVIFSILVLLAIFAYFRYQGSKKASDLTVNTDGEGQIEATLESKLKEIYEKQAGTDLGNDFSPRFSVFEDYQLGFRVAYPVGFNATSIGGGALFSPKSGDGSITLTVSNGSFEVKTNKDGLSEKQAEIIESSGIFIKDSFQFISPQEVQDLKERFSGGPGKDRY